jgi:DNA polymerase I
MLIKVDGNSLGHAFHRAQTLTHNGIQVQAIFGMIREMRMLKVANPGANIMILWDGVAKHRFEILPDYKGDRERKEQEDPEEAAMRAAYRAQVPIIKKAIELLGVSQVVHPDFEADDLAGALCSVTKGQPKRLVTGDTDWLQLVDETTEWYDPRNGGKKITGKDFFQLTGYASPDEYIQGKALQGDISDSIPGIPGVGPTTASMFFAKWRSMQAFYDAVDSGTYVPASRKSKNAKSLHPEQVMASPDGRALFRRNMALMDLRRPPLGIGQGIVWTKAPLNREAFQTLCARLGFASVLRDYDSWLLPFTQRELPMFA